MFFGYGSSSQGGIGSAGSSPVPIGVGSQTAGAATAPAAPYASDGRAQGFAFGGGAGGGSAGWGGLGGYGGTEIEAGGGGSVLQPIIPELQGGGGLDAFFDSFFESGSVMY